MFRTHCFNEYLSLNGQAFGLYFYRNIWIFNRTIARRDTEWGALWNKDDLESWKSFLGYVYVSSDETQIVLKVTALLVYAVHLVMMTC